ncbi:PLC-like phosphodiesterase [Kockovaella imperatae]|uniref:PLC-like phosphodiesterase n=1 Tax=Kockovaella imperatae TaxID=4999 RepID=A0A1Y1U9U0_9TREE|nr:PLC-like phosphodiesterase [Kockovaella imperatae]ORX34800.1 PLC-like phosphodiesterase [Kockovaella imperatae]
MQVRIIEPTSDCTSEPYKAVQFVTSVPICSFQTITMAICTALRVPEPAVKGVRGSRHSDDMDLKAASAQTSTRKRPEVYPNTDRPNVAQIRQYFKTAHEDDDTIFVSAHRGFTERGVVENTFPAILKAAGMGAMSVEIDIRLTADGVPVCLHDDGLGRVTNIGEVHGRKDIYDPLTGQGYNPLASSIPWHGAAEHLRLKDHLGDLTSVPIMTLESMVRDIIDSGIQVMVLLDIKLKDVMEPAYEVIRRFVDRNGQSALAWCIFKPDITFCPTPQSLREEQWLGRAAARGDVITWIPVFDIASPVPAGLQMLDLVKLWAAEPNTLALELGLRHKGGPLQEVVDWAIEGGTDLRLGFYGAFGDEWLEKDPRCPESSAPLVVWEDHPPTSFDGILQSKGISGGDRRGDLELFWGLGFSWIISDHVKQSAKLVVEQSRLGDRIAL